jgi:hypothetical protein
MTNGGGGGYDGGGRGGYDGAVAVEDGLDGGNYGDLSTEEYNARVLNFGDHYNPTFGTGGTGGSSFDAPASGSQVSTQLYSTQDPVPCTPPHGTVGAELSQEGVAMSATQDYEGNEGTCTHVMSPHAADIDPKVSVGIKR